jgi:hypothetical protein
VTRSYTVTHSRIPRTTYKLEGKDRSTFHLEEFKAIKAEIAEDLKLIATNFQFAATLSGAIAAWILAQGNVIPNQFPPKAALAAASWLPLLLSALFGFTTFAIPRRFKIKGGYIRTIEENWRFDNLG